MADSYTPYLNLRKPEVGAAKDNWGSIPGLNGDMDKIDAVFAPGGIGTPVGLHIGTGMVLDVDGTLLVAADRLELSDATDPTKLAHILLTGLATGANNNYFLPPIADILVGLTQPQHFAAKSTDDPPGGVIDVTQAVASAKWVQDVVSAAIATAISSYSAFNTGDIIASAAADKPGWLWMRGGTIGDASSGATARANADTRALFTLMWHINGNTWPINGGRTTSPDVDFDLHKTVTMPTPDGFVWAGIGGTLNLANHFATAGQVSQDFTAADIPSHTHSLGVPINRGNNAGLGGIPGPPGLLADLSNPASATLPSAGPGVMTVGRTQPSMGTWFWIKL